MNKRYLGIGIVMGLIVVIWCFSDKDFIRDSNDDEIFKVTVNETDDSEDITISTTTTTSNEIVDLNIIDTEGWQTCYNNLHGYQISYPEDWFVIIGDREGPVPLPITAKECQNGINLNAMEPYPSVGGGPYIFIERLSLSEKNIFENEKYLLEHVFNSFSSEESDITIFLAENSDKNYEFLIFKEEGEQAWKITVGRKTRQFAEAVVGTFRTVE